MKDFDEPPAKHFGVKLEKNAGFRQLVLELPFSMFSTFYITANKDLEKSRELK
jgi:hypothetical protein